MIYTRTTRPTGSAHPVIAIIVVVVGAVGLYTAAVRDNLSPKNFGVVDEGRIYRAGQVTPSAMRMIHDRYHIRTVIDFGSYRDGERVADPRGERRNQRTADALGITRFVLPLYGDGTGNLNRYIQALRIMTDPERQPVLVHCGAGAERTGVACALYRNFAHGTPLEDGLKDTASFKHDPRRNPRVEEIVRTWGPAIVGAARDGKQLSDLSYPPLPPPRPEPPAER